MKKRMTVNEHISLLQKASSEALDKTNYLMGYTGTLCLRLDEVCARLARLETAPPVEPPPADRWKLQQELAQMRKERDEARRERDHENAKYEEAAYNLKHSLASVKQLRDSNSKLWERLNKLRPL